MERWKCLTGAGSRSQRGLESPGAEVWHCSLKDEGDRQGDKHGPLSTWGSLWFYFSFTFLPFLSAVLWSFFMLLPVCGKPRVKLEWFEMTLSIFLFVFYWIGTLPLQIRLLVFYYFWSSGIQTSDAVLLLELNTAMCRARSRDFGSFGRKYKATRGSPYWLEEAEGARTVDDICYTSCESQRLSAGCCRHN